MSDSIKVIIIFYAGFILSLLIVDLLLGIITRSVKLLRKTKIS